MFGMLNGWVTEVREGDKRFLRKLGIFCLFFYSSAYKMRVTAGSETRKLSTYVRYSSTRGALAIPTMCTCIPHLATLFIVITVNVTTITTTQSAKCTSVSDTKIKWMNFLCLFQWQNEKLIRRWDSERELSLRRYCTRTKNTIDSCINSAIRRLLQRMFTKFGEITQCNGHYAVQGHSRSPILVPIESSYTTSY